MKYKRPVVKTIIKTLRKDHQMYPAQYLADTANTTIQVVYNVVHVLYKEGNLIKVREPEGLYYQYIH